MLQPPQVDSWRVNRYDEVATVVGTNGDTVEEDLIAVTSSPNTCSVRDDGAGLFPTYQLRVVGGPDVRCLLRIDD